MGVYTLNGTYIEKKKPKDAEVIPAEWVPDPEDPSKGKYIKTCECGCGTVFEVQPRNKGNQRYTKFCGSQIKKLTYKPKKAHTKVCKICLERKDKDLFIPGQQGRATRLDICSECGPFHKEWGRYAPSCGKWPAGEAVGDERCPLITECRARLWAGLWLPCTVPFRGDLIQFYKASKEDQAKYRAMVQHSFDPDRNVIPESIDQYLDYYKELE